MLLALRRARARRAARPKAHKLAAELDPEVPVGGRATTSEFGFADLAREYYGAAPTPAQAAAVAMLLHASPMHFYKKGKGRYRKAPAGCAEGRARLGRAQAARERADRGVGERARAHRLPERAARAGLPMLLYRPDKNALEWKALAAACEARKTNPVALLAACGAIPSTHDYHFNAFLAEAFPHGVAFPAWGTLPPVPELPRGDCARVLDRRRDDHRDRRRVLGARASQRQLRGRHPHRVPGARHPARQRRSTASRATRLSTVYMPGRKLTMLPDEAVAAFTLKAGHGAAGAVAVHRDDARRRAASRHATRVERVPVAANLRLDTVTRCVRQRRCRRPPIRRGRTELRVLWKLAQHLSDARGKNDIKRIDYSFDVDWDAAPGRARGDRAARARQPARQADRRADDPRQQHVGTAARRPRRRGAVPRAVGGQGQDEHAAGRAPGPRPHALPVGELAAAPLQRPRQPAAAARGAWPAKRRRTPTTTPSSSRRWPTSRRPTASTPSSRTGWSTTGACAGCCRKTSPRPRARVIRENLVRFERLPLVARVADLPPLPPDTPVRIADRPDRPPGGDARMPLRRAARRGA